MARGKRETGRKASAGKATPSIEPRADETAFDPMAVAARPLPELEPHVIGAVRLMFLGGADVRDVAAFLKVDVLTVEELIEAKPQLRPSIFITEAEAKARADAAATSDATIGRPTAYDPKFVRQAKQLASLGATDLELAQFFEVSVRTLHRWKVQHAKFREALDIGKEAADLKVEDSLYKRAVGYTFDSEKIVVVDKEVQRIETLEHVPPDTKAAMFWLQNRRPGLWRSVNHIKHDVEEGGELANWMKELQQRPNTLQPVEDAEPMPINVPPVSEEDDE